MKLRNKKTGEIKNVNHAHILIHFNDGKSKCVKSLAELNEEWEDYEEPKEFWYISDFGYVFNHAINNKSVKLTIEEMKSIGNYFETKEEAEKAVEKLKAWKRLKDNGFRLDAVVDTFFCLDNYMCNEPYEAIKDDLKIVFGDEK